MTTVVVVAGAMVAALVKPDLGKEAHRAVPGVSRVIAAVTHADHRPRPHHTRHDTQHDGIPAEYRSLYKKAADKSSCGISWKVLAGIGQVESGHGANTGPSTAGAQGPMQFMPATWRSYGLDGDGDGRKNIHDPADAIPAAAGYLCANHADRNLRDAIWHYNHSDRYVNDVLAAADRY